MDVVDLPPPTSWTLIRERLSPDGMVGHVGGASHGSGDLAVSGWMTRLSV